MPDKKPSLMYRIIKKGVHIVYPKTTVCGTENLPDEPVMFVGNHCQLHGPIVSELYMPVERYTWCAAQMMELREVPGYAFEDFWSHKPKYTHWFYRLLSYAIAPLSVIVFNNADTIPVYRDHRLMTTFRETLARLCEGRSVVIFPEHDPMKNNILAEFQEGFVDIARLYYRKTGKCVAFVPTYFAPNLHSVHFGRPLRYCPENSLEEERRRVCEYLFDEITAVARALPEHTVVPYRNVRKKDYPSNKDHEEK